MSSHTSYRFPHLTPPLSSGLRQDKTLAVFLGTRGLAKKDIVDGLQEYVWRSMGQGKRVRQWCNEVSQALARVHSSPAIGEALATPLLTTLIPFARLPTNPYFPTPEPPLPPPLLPNSFFATLARNQLIDALARLSKEDRLISKKLHYEQELVLELCLEYVGRRWRSSDAMAEHVVDDISRKLTEVEFEVHLQGYPPTVRTTISPILHKIRFTLGFITPSQLTAKLNSPGPSAYAYPPTSPAHVLSAWVERRLQTGVNYLAILGDLKIVKSGISDNDVDVLVGVLRDFGLDAHFLTEKRLPERRGRTLSSLKPKITPKWFSHKRANSSVSKPPFPRDHRRPSLPVISTTPASISGPFDDNTSQSSASSTRSGEDVVSLLGCSLPEVKSILLGQLLEMRYHIHGHEDDGWWLGGGKEQAEDMLSSLQDRLNSQHSLREVFDALRSTFGLSFSNDTNERVSRRLLNDALHARDVSFDLDQYLRDITLPARVSEEQDSEAQSSTEDSYQTRSMTPASFTSAWSANEDAEYLSRRSSRLSTFTIRQAVRKDPVKTRAVEFRFPSPGKVQAPASAEQERRRSRLVTRSVADFAKEETYTRMPDKVGLRKSRKVTRSALQLGRSDVLGLNIDTSTSSPWPSLPSPPSPTPSTPSSMAHTSFSHCDSLVSTPVMSYHTVTDQTRRQLHRQCVIFDGEPMSPSKHMDVWKKEDTLLNSPSSPTKLLPSALPRVLTDSSPRQRPDTIMESSEDDHSSSPTLSPTATHRDIVSPVSPVPLSSILNLFHDISNGHCLSAAEVEDALMRVVGGERRSVEDKGDEWDAEARCRVAWLIEQVAVLLDGHPTYLPAISNVVYSLSLYDMLPTPLENKVTSPPSVSQTERASEPHLPHCQSVSGLE